MTYIFMKLDNKCMLIKYRDKKKKKREFFPGLGSDL